MVKIKLQDFSDGIAKLHCLPNGQENQAFSIDIDVKNRKLLKNSLGYKDNYVVHAMYKIFEIFEETGNVPEEAVSIWY